jgi:hypothetical protein
LLWKPTVSEGAYLHAVIIAGIKTMQFNDFKLSSSGASSFFFALLAGVATAVTVIAPLLF